MVIYYFVWQYAPFVNIRHYDYDNKGINKDIKGDDMEKYIVMDEMTKSDWPAVQAIYEEGIQTGNATFDTVAPTWEEWNAQHIASCRFVVREDDRVIGWIALSPYSTKRAYQGVAEVSIYISQHSAGKGIGRKLMEILIKESEASGFWTLQAGIFPENTASLTLHKKFGFEEVGIRKRIGKLNGVWRDVVLLERRSSKVGMD
ncbi:GNAT family N-acetyltransferase [Oceanobacillus halotolerans]|uniref:GNAT family N-acetyltransferase n=1 Tax=Oceanobacillus halotolerans TaxID=2663380 RepID=UPI00299DAD40|nr:GNAT family N-acetyltransferase [Oceanobacillus halotolerans]